MRRLAIGSVLFVVLVTSLGAGAQNVVCQTLGPPCGRWASRSPVGPANEIHVAVDPTDSNHVLVVGKDYGLGGASGCGAFNVASASYVTFDGGQTWHTSRVPAPYPNGGAAPSPLPYPCGTDPVAMFGPDGTAYYMVLNYRDNGGIESAIAVARSLDGGKTWPAEEIRIVSLSANDKNWGTVDRTGRVHLVWTDFADYGIKYARSKPGEWAFETPRRIGSVGGGNPGVTVVTGPAGEVYAIWRDGSGIFFRKSLDNGETFGPQRLAFTANPYDVWSPAPRMPFLPMTASDDDPSSPFAGRVYVAFQDQRDDVSSVFVASSGDQGETWNVRRVDDDVLERRQIFPAVSVAPNGRVDTVWLDQRDFTIQLDSASFRLYQSSSYDGGLTWTPNRAVSDTILVSSRSHHQSGAVFIGDYIGAASANDVAWAGYPSSLGEREGQEYLTWPPERTDAFLAGFPPPPDLGGAGGVEASPVPAQGPAPTARRLL